MCIPRQSVLFPTPCWEPTLLGPRLQHYIKLLWERCLLASWKKAWSPSLYRWISKESHQRLNSGLSNEGKIMFEEIERRHSHGRKKKHLRLYRLYYSYIKKFKAWLRVWNPTILSSRFVCEVSERRKRSIRALKPCKIYRMFSRGETATKFIFEFNDFILQNGDSVENFQFELEPMVYTEADGLWSDSSKLITTVFEKLIQSLRPQ